MTRSLQRAIMPKAGYAERSISIVFEVGRLAWLVPESSLVLPLLEILSAKLPFL